MTTIASAQGETEVIHARRTEPQDVPGITALIYPATEITFGRVNASYLLEKANLAVTLSNENKEVVAHAALLDYPSCNDAIDQADWESWLHKNYDNSQKCTPLNTLFLHLLVAKEDFEAECGNEIMRAVFNAVPDLHFVFLLTPVDVKLAPGMEDMFSPMISSPESVAKDEFSLYVCHRHQHCPQLFIRIGRVRDHDDLVHIFMKQNDTLVETYGNYFLAELIEAQDEQNFAVVGEDNGVAVGFMSVCSEVNLKLLQDCFDLGPFHGLCKPHPDDILKPPAEPSATKVMSRQASPMSYSELSQESQEGESEESDIKIDSVTEEEAEVSENVLAEHTTLSSTSLVTEQEESSSRASSVAADVTQGVDAQPPGTHASDTETKDVFRPIYKGDLSAFCIQLFCIDQEHETRSQDFLHFVFNLFPDKDFCIVTVPQLVPEFHLLQRFVRVVPLPTCTLSQELYIFHRSGLLSSINVRPAKSSDFPAIESLVKTLDLHESMLNAITIYNQARRDPDGTPIQGFVVEVIDQIVGVSLIRNEEDIEFIRAHYNIEDFVYFNHHQREEHGHLYHFALNPIFKHYTKHFLKEILRLSRKSCLYYPIYPTRGEEQNPCAHSLTSALHYMVPVRPRRQIVYPLEKLGINAPSKRVSKDQSSYALYHINRKLTLEPKVTINARIVVVGASNVGISFLETLVFCPHLRLNNITLISTHGLPAKSVPGLTDGRAFLASSHCFNDKDYALMSLQSWVNVVVGKMTGIDRAAKYVLVSQTEKVPYDHLVLCTGLQYQVPCPTGADISKLLTNREIEDCSNQRYTGTVPSNLFTLQDEQDCSRALNWLKEHFVDKEGDAIVYGNSLDIYTTVETLLSLGIAGSRIHLVQPPRGANITCFNNYALEKAVEDAMSKAGVTTHCSCILANWNDGGSPDPITSASFTTDTKPFQIQCAVFFNFFKKRVDYEAFKAMNDACLVFDGKLVINTTFHTNDPTIRAAGPLTKFSNRYYANGWTHNNFNSKEVGFNLAANMLQLFDPTLEQVSEPPEDLDRLIPMYKGAKIQGGILPGGSSYLHVAKPATPTPLDAQMAQPTYGQEIVTGSTEDGNYFRLHVNQYNMVETITCLSQKPFPSSNYICLYGVHERFLNSLCSRFKEGLISDLYSYFSEPWSLPIFHDRFMDFRQEVRQILASAQGPGGASMEQLARDALENEAALTEPPRAYLKKCFEEKGFRRGVDLGSLRFLDYNRDLLPMFARPGMV
ncbi:cilia- and flagella-associated protein 61 [Ambystoma mexicanum]|uniref:cilia- and flagella-associated protein 61 n=1 Tax=Ambystoma mexicanum TaxID=8296 RepID=UPI0037E96A97